ncbi:DNA-binding protein [Xanthobacter sp. DSM 24535]|uniref:DNA-binding protein n=1 Tax=Roseixanthobacter psychrophilus TaxID=3119917 RepID=UPI0037291855
MEQNPKSDVLVGVSAIAAHLGMSARQAKHRVHLNMLPVFRMGRTVCARKTTLNEWMAKQEAESTKVD